MTIEFTAPWSAPRPVTDMVRSLDETALRRFISGLSKTEYDRFWAALCAEGDIPPADPRQTLAWHVRKERWDRYTAWFNKLDCVQKSAAYLALVAACDGSADPEELMKQF
jgi:hypothetical protein